MMAQSIAPIAETVTVALTPDRAFALFTSGFGTWWPTDYTYAGAAGLASISLGMKSGDLCHEIGPHGFRVDWGRLLEVEPPRRLRILWQIAPDRTPQPDPAQSSEVEVRFTPTPLAGTEVRLTHDAFGRCGEAGAAYRDETASGYGWPLILANFADRAARG